ncbi:hypothetical protein LTR78_006523 [Recurvomyces mirabilis]|uniref:Uncharacterized protein n=1 Tax=Recurvomyces mirabilis TaxID=574656 RepID=A0AAE0WKY8_9PEZI|nr:hypothetical protein LTR78_006523 [Recurvomyces mirabilis]KAK5151059.1 hypothetical protein LTS14_009554 [Recurvomyces mirabilis]
MVAPAYPPYHLEPQPPAYQLHYNGAHYGFHESSEEEDEPIEQPTTVKQGTPNERQNGHRRVCLLARINAFMHPNARRSAVDEEAVRLANTQAQVIASILLEGRPERRMLYTNATSTPQARARQHHLGQARSHLEKTRARNSAQPSHEQGYSTPRGGTRLDSVAEDPAEHDDDTSSEHWIHVLGRGKSDQVDGWHKVKKPLPPPPVPRGADRLRDPRRGDYRAVHASRLQPTSSTRATPASLPPQPTRVLRKVRGACELKYADDSGVHTPRSSLTSSDRSLESDHVQNWVSTQDPIQKCGNRPGFVHPRNKPPPPPHHQLRTHEHYDMHRQRLPLGEPELGGLYGILVQHEKDKRKPLVLDGVRRVQRPTDPINGIRPLSRPASSSELDDSATYYKDNGPDMPPTRLYSHDRNSPDPRWVDVPLTEKIMVKKPVRQVKSMPVLERQQGLQQHRMAPVKSVRPSPAYAPASTTNDTTQYSVDMVPPPLRTKRSTPSVSTPSIDSVMGHWNRTVLVPNTDGHLRTVNGLASQASMISLGSRSTASYRTAKPQISMPDLRIRYRQSSNDLRGHHRRTQCEDVGGQMLKFPPPVRLGARVGRNGSIQSKDYGQIGAGYSGVMSSLTRYPSASETPTPSSDRSRRASRQPEDQYLMSGGLGHASSTERSVSLALCQRAR